MTIRVKNIWRLYCSVITKLNAIFDPLRTAVWRYSKHSNHYWSIHEEVRDNTALGEGNHSTWCHPCVCVYSQRYKYLPSRVVVSRPASWRTSSVERVMHSENSIAVHYRYCLLADCIYVYIIYIYIGSDNRLLMLRSEMVKRQCIETIFLYNGMSDIGALVMLSYKSSPSEHY